MKLYKIFISILSLWLAIGCAKDKGNYTYTEAIKIEVQNVKNVSMVSSRELNIKPNIIVTRGKDTIDKIIQTEESNIVPKLNSDLSFYWEIAGKKVSESMNIKELVEGSGEQYSRYVITDNKSGVKYFFPFRINLTSPFAAGYFALAEANNKQTILTFKSTRVGEEANPIITVADINGIEFGSEPIYLGNRPTQSGPTSYSNYDLYISSRKGDKKVFLTDLLTFSYKGYIDETSTIGLFPNDFTFEAEANTNSFYIVKGRLSTINSNMIYRPAAPTMDYYLAPWIGTGGSFANSCLLGFDKKNGRFLHFIKQVSDPINGIIADNYALDRVTPVNITVNDVATPDFCVGHRFLSGGFHGASNPLNQKAVTVKGDKLYFYSFLQPWDNPTFHFPTKSKLEGELAIPGVNDNSCAVLNTTTFDWVLAVGNKIYSSTSEIVTSYRELFSLPAGTGDINNIILIKKDFKILNPVTQLEETISKTCALLSTYNPQATSENKGSLYVVNLEDNVLIESYPNCTGRVVSLFFSLMK